MQHMHLKIFMPNREQTCVILQFASNLGATALCSDCMWPAFVSKESGIVGSLAKVAQFIRSIYSSCWIVCRRHSRLPEACLLQHHHGHTTTHDACWDTLWAQKTFHISCTRTAWMPSVSACERVGWSDRRTPCRSARSRMVSHQCVSAGAPAATTAARTTCHRPNSGIWGRELTRASTVPASTRTPAADNRPHNIR